MNAKKVALLFTTLVLCLTAFHVTGSLLIHYLGRDYGLMPMFDLDAEANIPTLYSSLALFFCAAMLAFIAVMKRKEGASHWPWTGLTVIFLFLCVDESTQFHERLIDPLRAAFDTSGLLYYPWVVPYAVLALIVSVAYLRFLINLPAQTRYLFVTGGLLYVSGALVLEMLSGQRAELHGMDATYVTIITVEELLEMIGVVVFIYALLSYIHSELKERRLSIRFS